MPQDLHSIEGIFQAAVTLLKYLGHYQLLQYIFGFSFMIILFNVATGRKSDDN